MTEKQLLHVVEKVQAMGFQTVLQEYDFSFETLLNILWHTTQIPQITLEEQKDILDIMERELVRLRLQDKKIGVLADTHIGNSNENPTYLALAYETFLQEKVQNVIHLGDFVDGYSVKKKDEFSKGKIACEMQIEKVESCYPKDFHNHIMFGNHEDSFSYFGIDLVKRLSLTRKDLCFFKEKFICMDWDGRKIKLTHRLTKESPEWLRFLTLSLGGHCHYYQYNAEYHTLKVPTCSSSCLNQGAISKWYPGFLILENKEKGIVVHRYGFCDEKVQCMLKRVIK